MELKVNLKNVKTLIGEEPKAVPVIPTATTKKRIATGILNSFLREQPQYTEAVYCLVSYPVLKWISTVREASAIESWGSEMVSENRKECFSIYSELISTVDNAAEDLRLSEKNGEKKYKCFADVHCNGESVSTYHVNTHYRSAIEYICSHYGKRLSEINSKLSMCTIQDYMNKAEIGNPILNALLVAMEGNINLYENMPKLLLSHPKDGRQTSDVFTALLRQTKDMTAEEMYDSVGMSRNTFKRYKNEALNEVAQLVYGASVEEIIFWLWEAQTEERKFND